MRKRESRPINFVALSGNYPYPNIKLVSGNLSTPLNLSLECPSLYLDPRFKASRLLHFRVWEIKVSLTGSSNIYPL